MLGVVGGVGSWSEGNPFAFKTGTGQVTNGGPVWGARVGYEFLRWFAVEAHYDGFYSKGNSQLTNAGGTIGLLTNSATAVLRFTLPLRYVQPYLFAGFGVYSTGITGSSEAKARTAFHSSTEPGIPMGVGVDIPVTWHFSVGAEMTYHRLFGESFADDDEIGGGDPLTGTVALRFRL